MKTTVPPTEKIAELERRIERLEAALREIQRQIELGEMSRSDEMGLTGEEVLAAVDHVSRRALEGK